MRQSRTGTSTSRGRFKTTRQYTLDGAPYRKEFVQRSGESKRSVIFRADEWLHSHKGSRSAPIRLLSNCISLYLEYRQDDDIAEVTLRDDEYVGGLLSLALGAQDIERIDAIGVELALRQWTDKPRTAKKIRDFGRKLYKWLCKRDWVFRNPFTEAKPVRYSPESWEEPMKALEFDLAITHVEDPSLRSLLVLLRSTGIRPKSGRELLWSEIIDGERMFIKKRIAKSPAGTQKIPVPSLAADLIRSLPKKGVLVFPSTKSGGPWSENWVGKIWRDAQLAAGLEPRPVYDLKHLRVTELREVLKDDVMVAAAAGLKSAEVVRQSYAQIDRNELHRAVDSMNKV